MTGRVLERCREASGAEPQTVPVEELVAREREVLQLMGRGLSGGEIAAALVVSGATVKSHVGRICATPDLRDRAAAIVHAFDRGLVTPDH